MERDKAGGIWELSGDVNWQKLVADEGEKKG